MAMVSLTNSLPVRTFLSYLQGFLLQQSFLKGAAYPPI